MKKKFLSIVLSSLLVLTSIGIPGKPVLASTTLTVDCGDTLREVTHCASGSLYGVTESLPADITNLVEPLKPNVFTNPALAGSDNQQLIGAAIPVAGRLANTTGKVMIRLADVFPSWPYGFTNMEDWLSKVTTVINNKKASGYSNFYGYEIWNEPCYTWTSTTVTYKDMWLQTYKLIRSLDPDAQIVGPSEGYYSHDKMEDFLTYCKENDCIPDVICWHELGSEGVAIEGVSSDIKDLKALESTLGISERKISINEYCDTNHSTEGQPGSSARYIAKFERNLVDSACISWWWTGAPGRLGSLMASDTEKGAGWWFYKWYGDMTGNMVNVIPPNDDSDEVDGFACVDSDAKYISTLLGGVNDGNINVTLKNIPSFIGSTANVVVEKVDWTSKDTPVTGTSIVSANNYTVTHGTINVSIQNTNSSSGYRVYVIPSTNVTDNEAVEYESSALENSLPSSTKTNLTLPTAGSYDTKISWSSSNPSVIDSDGVVNRTENDENVTLTATISKGESVSTKEFTVLVNRKLTSISETPIYKYDFSTLNESNEVVNSGSKAGDATLVGSAKIVQDDERGNVLQIKSNSTDEKVNYLALPSSTFNGITTDGFTVGMWINVDSTDSNYSKWSSLFEATTNNGYPMTKMGADLLSRINAGNGSWADTTASAVKANTWQYATYTVNSTGIYVYLNGSQVNSAVGDITKSLANNILSSINDVRVGSGNIWGDRDIASAKFDDVAIYNTALTADEVEALYNEEASSTVTPSLTDSEAVQSVANVLESSIPTSVITNITLPTTGSYDTTISWSSSNPSIINNDGEVYCTENDENVTLTATITKGEAVSTKEFNVVVKSAQTLYEAENATISNANTFSSTNASNGTYVGQIDYNNSSTGKYSYVEFNVNVPRTQKYTMTIRYANGGTATSTQGLLVNGGEWSTVSYPVTGAWAQFASVNTTIGLIKGANTIRLAKGSSGFEGGTDYAELDYIELNAAPTVNSVVINPLSASVVKSGSKQLSAVVDTTTGAADTVTWSSSDTTGSSVTVDENGLVTVAADAELGDYAITATSTEDSSKFGTAIITVTDKSSTSDDSTQLSITEQPSSQTVTEGDTASFKVEVSGTEPITYQWQKDKTNLTDGDSINGANGANLKIKDVRKSDGGEYICTITDDSGNVTTSSAATLSVTSTSEDTSSLSITKQPSSQTVSKGNAASFSIEVSGKEPFTYQWQKDGIDLNNGDRISGTKESNITIKNVVESDEGEYNCIVTDGVGNVTTSSAATLSVTVTSNTSKKSHKSSSNSSKDSYIVTINADETAIITAINTSSIKTIIINADNLVRANINPLISQNILVDLKSHSDKTLVLKTSNSSIEIKSKNGQIQFTENGVIVTGVKAVGNAKYYLDTNGNMQVGWVRAIDNNWYYLSRQTGVMEEGWIQDTDGKWYYLDRSTGVMKTGWIQDNGKWYYLYSNGALAISTTIDGYVVNENGEWI